MIVVYYSPLANYSSGYIKNCYFLYCTLTFLSSFLIKAIVIGLPELTIASARFCKSSLKYKFSIAIFLLMRLTSGEFICSVFIMSSTPLVRYFIIIEDKVLCYRNSLGLITAAFRKNLATGIESADEDFLSYSGYRPGHSSGGGSLC